MEHSTKLLTKTQSLLYKRPQNEMILSRQKPVAASAYQLEDPHGSSKATKLQYKSNNSLKYENKSQLASWSNAKLQDFRFKNLIGTGKFSKVYLAINKTSNSLVAVKVINKREIRRDNLEHQIVREVNIQSKLDHPNIVKLFTHFTDHVNIYLILEFLPGEEVYKHLKNSPSKRFSNRLAAKYIYQVASALQYCHQRNVMHRDIKPENLILTSNGDVKLSDFGWSVYSPRMKRTTLCGTLDYIAPEMIRREYYDERVDNWCLGVLCYEFLVGSPPFQSKNDTLTFQKISNVQITYPKYMCRRAIDLISKLLQKNPKNRLSLSGVKEHDWVVSKMDFQSCQTSLSVNKNVAST